MQDHRVSFSFPEQIKFTKGPGGFGLRFGGAANQVEGQQFGLGVFIAGVKPGGAGAAALAANSEVEVGFQIVTLNGQDMTTASTAELAAALKSIGNELELECVKNAALFDTYSKGKAEKVVRVTKNAAGFGLRFGGAANLSEGDE